ncbi:hypothetical protein EJB05_37395, partial [Eragrostis curvula]
MWFLLLYAPTSAHPVLVPPCLDGIPVGSDTQFTAERSQKLRAVFPRDGTRGATPEQVLQPDVNAGTGGSQMGNSHIGGNSSSNTVPQAHRLDNISSMIQLNEPPITLKPSENHPKQDAVEIAIVKLLIKSYYDIVRKNIEDAIPKAVMNFLVNHTKRELHNFLIRELYSFNLLNELMRETDEVIIRRQRIQETLEVLEQAHRTLEEFLFEAEKIEKGYNRDEHDTGLPRIRGLSDDGPYGIFTSSPNH